MHSKQCTGSVHKEDMSDDWTYGNFWQIEINSFFSCVNIINFSVVLFFVQGKPITILHVTLSQEQRLLSSQKQQTKGS